MKVNVYHQLTQVNFSELMSVYIEAIEENAQVFYTNLERKEALKQAELDFYNYLENSFFKNKEEVYVILEMNNHYITCLRLQPTKDGLLLEALETKPCFRQNGYATFLIQEVQKQISKPIYSYVSKKNIASLKTHQKCGFQIIAENQKQYTLCQKKPS